MSMYKRGEGDFGNLLWEYISYLVITALFVFLMFGFVQNFKNAGAILEDFYAKEIVKVIDSSEPGDIVQMNVQEGTKIAFRNKVSSKSEIFTFNNVRHEVCVKFGAGQGSCYYFFRDIAVANPELVLGAPENVLYFSIIESRSEGGTNG